MRQDILLELSNLVFAVRYIFDCSWQVNQVVNLPRNLDAAARGLRPSVCNKPTMFQPYFYTTAQHQHTIR